MNVLDNAKLRDRIVAVINEDDSLELIYIKYDSGVHTLIDDTGKFYRFDDKCNSLDSLNIELIFNLDSLEDNEDPHKPVSHKYLFIYFGDNHFTIPFQQAAFVIVNAMRYNVKKFINYKDLYITCEESEYKNSYKDYSDTYLKEFQKFLDRNTFENLLLTSAAYFNSLFDITIHAEPKISMNELDWFIKEFKFEPKEIMFGTKEEIDKVFPDSFMNGCWRDGGIWITIGYDKNNDPVEVEGGCNYINENYLLD